MTFSDYDHAISDCTEAIRLYPNYILAYNNRATAYGKQGKNDKANADFTKAKELEAGQ
jgi:Tfp pilus assembly protein PilF